MSELKINLGCGDNRLEGWSNHDMDVDITKPLPWGDNTVDFILAEHVFEHINGPDALRFLDECYRVLKKDGVLRLCVPGIDRLDYDHARDIVLNHGHLCAYTEESLQEMLRLTPFILRNVRLDLPRADCDGHWKIIGADKDKIETHRIEATK